MYVCIYIYICIHTCMHVYNVHIYIYIYIAGFLSATWLATEISRRPLPKQNTKSCQGEAIYYTSLSLPLSLYIYIDR